MKNVLFFTLLSVLFSLSTVANTGEIRDSSNHTSEWSISSPETKGGAGGVRGVRGVSSAASVVGDGRHDRRDLLRRGVAADGRLEVVHGGVDVALRLVVARRCPPPRRRGDLRQHFSERAVTVSTGQVYYCTVKYEE